MMKFTQIGKNIGKDDNRHVTDQEETAGPF